MKLHLISFKTCPYVQRSVIALRHKQIPFEITYIDLAAPPAWFAAKSPLGKVPILEVTEDSGDSTVLFESAVLCEFIDEVTGGGLVPDNAVHRARDRAWVAFGSECLGDYYQAAMAGDAESHHKHVANLVDKLEKLQAEVAGPLWRGSELGLVDCAVAPLLMRLAEFAHMTDTFSMDQFPKLTNWNENLQHLPEVAHSMVPEWRELLHKYILTNGRFIASVAA